MKVNIKKGDYIVTDDQTKDFIQFCVDKFVEAGCGEGEGTLYWRVIKNNGKPWVLGWCLRKDSLYYTYLPVALVKEYTRFNEEITQQMLSWYEDEKAVQEQSPDKLSLDEFDKRLKELLTQAGQAGYWIDNIGTGWIESSACGGETTFVLQDCRYEVNS